MFRNAFKTAWRNLWKSHVYIFTNIAGLSLGFASVMLIILYVKDDLSFDRFHRSAKHIYRIVHSSRDQEGKLSFGSNTGGLEAEVFSGAVPELQSTCRFMGGSDQLVKRDDEIFSERVDFADANFFTFFSFRLLHGQPAQALDQPNKVVISRDVAIKYFGNENAVGKILKIHQDGQFQDFMVSAVSAETPLNSSLQFRILLPVTRALRQEYTRQWFMGLLNTFVLVDEKAATASIENKMQRVFEAQARERLQAIRSEFGSNFSFDYKLQPLLNIHRDKVYTSGNGITNWNNPQYVYILGGITIFILLIACINFINQSLARLLKRGKEVGIRKVVGGTRKQLIWQFLSESFLINLLSFVPALAIVILSLPLFSSMANKEFKLSYLFNAEVISLFSLLILINAVLAGLYPALLFSNFNPVKTLNGKLKVGGRQTFGKVLLAVQFVISISLIIGTLVMQRQFNYMMRKDLGFTATGVLNIQLPYTDQPDIGVLKNELARNRYVRQVGAQSIPIISENKMDVQAGDKTIPAVPFLKIDNNFITIMNIPLVAGRNFRDHQSDSSNCIVNLSFVRAAKWNAPLGKKLIWNGAELTVIGIVADFHIASLKNAIGPVLLNQPKQWLYGQLAVKVDADSKAKAIAAIEAKYKQLVPLFPFKCQMLDEMIASQYADEQRWNKVILVAAVISIFISCMGLFALFSLSIEHRTREIGIRKVMGSSAVNIVKLLSGNFLLMIVIASLIAVPLSAWIMHGWLESFAYRIALQWWIFAIACLMTLAIGFVTIAFQTIRAARSNPVKSLHTD